MIVLTVIRRAILLNMACTVLAHADNHNYVKTVEMLTSNGSNGIKTIQYYDGLGRALYDVSPYAYCAGDPVNCVDPDGIVIEPIGSRLPQWIGYKNGFRSYITK